MAQESVTCTLEQYLTEKYKIHFKEIDKGETCAAISRTNGIAKRTLSGWIKEKSKIYDEVEKNRTIILISRTFSRKSDLSRDSVNSDIR